MGIGYVFGCLISILLWNFNRHRFFEIVDNGLKKFFKINFIVEFIYAAFIIAIYGLYYQIGSGEIANCVTLFIVIDISFYERCNLKFNDDKISFYDSLSKLTSGIICGFIAPLFYIIILKNNYFGIIYFILYHMFLLGEYRFTDVIFKLATILPSLIFQGMIYVIYIYRNRKLKIDFKGKYFANMKENPLLNAFIMAAYTEKVNFYCAIKNGPSSYIKKYGNYKEKIDKDSIKDYLGIIYSMAFISFAVFLVIIIV